MKNTFLILLLVQLLISCSPSERNQAYVNQFYGVWEINSKCNEQVDELLHYNKVFFSNTGDENGLHINLPEKATDWKELTQEQSYEEYWRVQKAENGKFSLEFDSTNPIFDGKWEISSSQIGEDQFGADLMVAFVMENKQSHVCFKLTRTNRLFD